MGKRGKRDNIRVLVGRVVSAHEVLLGNCALDTQLSRRQEGSVTFDLVLPFVMFGFSAVGGHSGFSSSKHILVSTEAFGSSHSRTKTLLDFHDSKRPIATGKIGWCCCCWRKLQTDPHLRYPSLQ